MAGDRQINAGLAEYHELQRKKKLEVLKSKILGDPEIKNLRRQVATLVEALKLDYGCTDKEIQEYLDA